MPQLPSMSRRGRRRAWGIAALTTATAIGASGFALVRWRAASDRAAWAAIEERLETGRWAQARPDLERWIAAHPDDDAARIRMAEVELRARHREAAAGLLRTISPESPEWARAQMVLGSIAVMERRTAEAERCFRAVADRDPRALEPRRNLIYLYSVQMRTAEARDVLWEIYRIDEDPKVLVDLVVELLTEPDVRGLAPELEPLYASTPDDPMLARAWGMWLLYHGRSAEALPPLERAARSLANDPAGRVAMAECALIAGRTVDPSTILGPVPDDPVDASEWWLDRGRLEESSGSSEAALASFERSTRLNPRDPQAHHRLGQALRRAGREREAAESLARADRIEKHRDAVRRAHRALQRSGPPRDPDAIAELARLCAEAGLNPEASAWCEQALKRDPSRSDIRARLDDVRDAKPSIPIALARPVRSSGASVVPDAPIPTIASSEAPPFEERAEAAGLTYFYESGAGGDRMFIADTMGGGVGLIDADGDGWLDIYLVNGCRLPLDEKDPPRPNVLFRNRRDGTFEDITAKAGVTGRGYGMGCAVGDIDNDGDDDLFVTGYRGTLLYRNRGDGTFEDVTAAAGVSSDRWTTAAGFGDLDGDGDLDLAVIAYVDVAPDDARRCLDNVGRPIHCTPGVYAPQPDLLYRNNGDGTFTEVGQEAGLADASGRGLGLAIADFDDDGKLDLFVANDATPDFLYRNRGGLRFEEVGLEAGVATNGDGRATASMGVVADDLDGDGRIDLFITNLVNESNTFLRNLGGGLFVDATLSAGLDAPSRVHTGFGDAALDADNDGHVDLFVANGHVDDRPWANSPMAQVQSSYRGRGGGRFTPMSTSDPASYFSRRVSGRGVAAGDLDNDGRVDLVVVHRDAPAALLRNRAEGGHWLALDLRGSRSGKTPVGARATCRAGGRTSVRWVTSGAGYLSAHDRRLRFGLGDAAVVERLEVRWPSGAVQTWTDLPADRILSIEEGNPSVSERTSKQ